MKLYYVSIDSPKVYKIFFGMENKKETDNTKQYQEVLIYIYIYIYSEHEH